MKKILKLTYCQLVAAVIALFICSSALSQNVRSAYERMQDMMDSSAKTNYSGLATYEKSGQLKTLRVIHLTRNGKILEKIARLDGPLDSLSVWRNQACRSTDESFHLDKLASGSGTNLSKLAESYTFEIRGQQRIANRLSTIILINPKDQFRLPHLITIDNQSDLVLKSVVLDNAGKPLERLQFLNIEIGGDLDKIDVSADLVAPCQEALIESIAAPYQPSWIPPGYSAVFSNTNGQVGQVMTTFSDGLASFSVFVESAQMSAMLPPFSSNRGATTAVSTKVDMGNLDLTVSVVGEISMETAERIARSVISGSEIR